MVIGYSSTCWNVFHFIFKNFWQQYLSVKKQLIVIASMYFFLNREANAFPEPGIDEPTPVPLPTALQDRPVHCQIQRQNLKLLLVPGSTLQNANFFFLEIYYHLWISQLLNSNISSENLMSHQPGEKSMSVTCHHQVSFWCCLRRWLASCRKSFSLALS